MNNEKTKNVVLDYDIDKLTKGDKQLVQEISDLLDKNENTRTLSEQLRQKYDIDASEIMPIENSTWHTFSKDFNLGDSVGGFTHDYSKTKRTRVPFLNLSADLRTLNAFVEYVYDTGYKQAKIDLEKDNK